MTADYIIRQAEERDLEEILALMGEHAEFEQASFSSRHKIVKLGKALFDQPAKLHCWVVKQGGNLTGYVSFTFDFSTWDAEDFMYMDCLYLREGSRGKGIGAVILERLKQVARERNCINIQWQTPAFNEPAIRFYEKNNAVSKSKARFTLQVIYDQAAAITTKIH